MKDPFVEVTLSINRNELARWQRLQNNFERTCLKMDGAARKYIRLRRNPEQLGKVIEYRAAISEIVDRYA